MKGPSAPPRRPGRPRRLRSKTCYHCRRIVAVYRDHTGVQRFIGHGGSGGRFCLGAWEPIGLHREEET